jgi:hypothetical protein
MTHVNDERIAGYLAGIDSADAAPCPLCNGEGIWSHADGDGWTVEVCPECDDWQPAGDVVTAASIIAGWTPAQLALAQEASAETERRFATMTAFVRGLMTYREFAAWMQGYYRRVMEWDARRKVIEVEVQS